MKRNYLFIIFLVIFSTSCNYSTKKDELKKTEKENNTNTTQDDDQKKNKNDDLAKNENEKKSESKKNDSTNNQSTTHGNDNSNSNDLEPIKNNVNENNSEKTSTHSYCNSKYSLVDFSKIYNEGEDVYQLITSELPVDKISNYCSAIREALDQFKKHFDANVSCDLLLNSLDTLSLSIHKNDEFFSQLITSMSFKEKGKTMTLWINNLDQLLKNNRKFPLDTNSDKNNEANEKLKNEDKKTNSPAPHNKNNNNESVKAPDLKNNQSSIVDLSKLYNDGENIYQMIILELPVDKISNYCSAFREALDQLKTQIDNNESREKLLKTLDKLSLSIHKNDEFFSQLITSMSFKEKGKTMTLWINNLDQLLKNNRKFPMDTNSDKNNEANEKLKNEDKKNNPMENLRKPHETKNSELNKKTNSPAPHNKNNNNESVIALDLKNNQSSIVDLSKLYNDGENIYQMIISELPVDKISNYCSAFRVALDQLKTQIDDNDSHEKHLKTLDKLSLSIHKNDDFFSQLITSMSFKEKGKAMTLWINNLDQLLKNNRKFPLDSNAKLVNTEIKALQKEESSIKEIKATQSKNEALNSKVQNGKKNNIKITSETLDFVYNTSSNIINKIKYYYDSTSVEYQSLIECNKLNEDFKTNFYNSSSDLDLKNNIIELYNCIQPYQMKIRSLSTSLGSNSDEFIVIGVDLLRFQELVNKIK